MELLKPKIKNFGKIVRVLYKGGVVICPTDTVYGFLALAENIPERRIKTIGTPSKVKESKIQANRSLFLKNAMSKII
jgi:tRNA A37 threonylcarbamoyladenosine synthetase subunit TsaC/SUA5/YrdC